MSKATKTINKITTLLQSVSGLYLDDEQDLNKIYKDVKKFVKKSKERTKIHNVN